MKSAPPAAELGRKSQTNMSGAPGVDGCFYTLYFEEERCNYVFFLKNLHWLNIKGTSGKR